MMFDDNFIISININKSQKIYIMDIQCLGREGEKAVFTILYVPQAIAELKDWMVILIFIPTKKPLAPSSFQID